MQILTYLRIHYNSPKQLRNNDNANGGNGTEQIPTVSEPGCAQRDTAPLNVYLPLGFPRQ